MLRKENILLISALSGSMSFAQSIVHQPVNPNGVTPIRTALDHISILALPEKITRVAAGSDTMQVEWHENIVFIKPLKTGASTNLVVWTEHQMSTYELEAPRDVTFMSSVIDETATVLPGSQSQTAAAAEADRVRKQRIADSVIGTTLLSANSVVSRDIRPAQDVVSVQIKEVVRSANSIYVRFAVTNTGTHPYRVFSPNVFTIVPTKNERLIDALRNYQIPEKTTYQFQSHETAQVQVRGTELPKQDVAPGATVEGVLALDRPENKATDVYQFIFDNDGAHRVQATAVL